MARVLLVLPAGTYRAEEYLAAARALHVEVVVASDVAPPLAATMGARFVTVPLDEPERAATLLAAHDDLVGIDAVVAADDEGLLVAALTSERLGLTHSPPEAVRATRDKAAMRARFAAGEIAQPRFEVVGADRPAEVAAAAVRVGLPVVVKPTSLAGSRGVIRADTPDAARAAARRIGAILADAGEPESSPLLVERFVPGPEVAVEAICSGGRFELVTVFDKPDPLDGPFFEETIYLAPTALPEPLAALVVATAERAAAALGLTDGPVHAELRVPAALDPLATPPVAVLEVAGRTIGGRCSKAFALEGGATLEQLQLARALGRTDPPARLEGPAGVLMIPIPASGRLVEVRHLDEVRAIEAVTGVDITIPVGQTVRSLPEGDRYLGFVFAAAPTRDAVERALRRARSRIEVVVEPLGPTGVREATAAGGEADTVSR